MGVLRCPSSSGLSLAVGLCLLSLSLTASYSLRRRVGGVDYYGNGRGASPQDWHRGLEHLAAAGAGAFPSPLSAGQRLDEDDGGSSSISGSSIPAGLLFYAAAPPPPRFLRQMGRGMESGGSSAAAGTGGVTGTAAEDRVRRTSSLLRPTEREIQQFRESADWSIPMSSVTKRNLCCSLDMYCVDCNDRK